MLSAARRETYAGFLSDLIMFPYCTKLAVTETSRPLVRCAGRELINSVYPCFAPRGLIDNPLEELSLYRGSLYRKSRLLVRSACIRLRTAARSCREEALHLDEGSNIFTSAGELAGTQSQ